MGLPKTPALQPDSRSVEVVATDGTVIARASASIRVLETASPPTFYLSPESLMVSLDDVPGTSFLRVERASVLLCLCGCKVSLALRQTLGAVCGHRRLVFILCVVGGLLCRWRKSSGATG